MKLNVQHLNIRPFHTQDSWIERDILALGEERRIDMANVRLVRLENTSPAYEVRVHLVTPGPDLGAAKRDHTLRAAFAKTVRQLREQIISRADKRLRRLKGHLQGRRTG